MAGFLNISQLRFFAASLAVHIGILLLLYPMRPVRVITPETIPVSLLNPPDRQRSAPTMMPHQAPTRATKKPTIVAKKDSPPRPDRNVGKNSGRTEFASVDPARSNPSPPAPPPHETIPERSVIAERPLPTLKELLPPVNWAASAHNSAPVSLNSRDPIYVTYFTKLKQLIESQWEYPELALRYGLQGKLSLEFTIGANGQLEGLRLVRSSGSQLLDDEALRAIKAASPFPPIPPWVKPQPLSISASMEYHDNRLNYRFTR
ncbi:MAG: energy transducer TonB [Chloroflexota bacterium]